MQGRKAVYLLGTAIGALLAQGPLRAGETVNYTYDALGRLVAVAATGTVNNGLSVSTSYDPAGNRSNYTVNGASPPPPPPNNPPTPVANTGAQQKCTTATYNVTANDTDPDGDYPLALVSVTGTGFSVLSSTTIQFTSASPTGAKVGTYTVQDSRGATATSTLTVTVSGGSCL